MKISTKEMMKLCILAVVGSSSTLPLAASPFANQAKSFHGTHDVSVTQEPNSPVNLPSGTTKHAQLHFHGEFRHDHIFTVPTTHASTRRFFSFFQNKGHRNLLLKGGGNPAFEIPPTQELLAEWTTQSQLVSSTAPMPFDAALDKDDADDENNDHDHAVVAIHSTVPVVPGLSIQAISYTGCRLLAHPRTKLPMYEFTLIQDRYQAQGTKPLVWIYRKITGEAPPTTSSAPDPLLAATSTTGSRITKGLCRVALEHGGGDTWRLSCYSMVNVSCTLPQKLLKLLPLTKQKVEAKISATMVKQLEREILQSADKFHKALQVWLQLREE